MWNSRETKSAYLHKKRFALEEGAGEVLFRVQVCNTEFNEAGV